MTRPSPQPTSAALTRPCAELDAALQRLNTRMDWERQDRNAMQVGTAAVRAILRQLGDPQRAYRCMHITGTKGKGTVAAWVAAGLHAAGLAVGRYASPALLGPTDVLHLNGQRIAPLVWAQALNATMDAADAVAPAATHFEVQTAAALLALQRAGVTWAVVEVGLGGRDDATNVLAAEVAVLTNLGLEHTEVLGPRIEDIAAHKVGIVHPGSVLVTPVAPGQSGGATVHAHAVCVGASVEVVALAQPITPSSANLAIARRVLDVLGRMGVMSGAAAGAELFPALSPAQSPRRSPASVPVSGDFLTLTLASQHALPGRLQVWPGPPVTVADGAHVGFAVRAVLAELRHGSACASARTPVLQRPPTLVLGLGADKDASAMLCALAESAAPAPASALTLIAVPLPNGRACHPPQALAALACQLGLQAIVANDLASGLHLAHTLAGPQGWVWVTGSLHLAVACGDILPAWGSGPSLN